MTAVALVDDRTMKGSGQLRLTLRGRIVFGLVAALLMSAVLLLWGGRAVASSPGTALEVRVHTVAPGETLWQHAKALAGSGEDVRDVVAQLIDLNGLDSANLQAGQRIVLPLG
jgi:hypothetical protein